MDKLRTAIDHSMRTLLFLFVFLAIVPLLSVLTTVVTYGWSALSFSFFTELPRPIGETGGGIANAILGTLLLVGVASLIAGPWGLLLGIFLSEERESRLSRSVRLALDILASVPSIIIGIFAYVLVVVPTRRFSALAGGVALALIMVPVAARTCEEVLKLLPASVREAGLALGIPRWRLVLSIVLPSCLGGVLTALLLSVARVAGETAPLLFTAFNNRFLSFDLLKPIASVPVQIYSLATSPYPSAHDQAWAAALVLILMVMGLNLLTRAVFRVAR